LEFVLSLALLLLLPVRNRLPPSRHIELERETGLQVRLVEAGKYRARIGWHEERVEVLRAVLAVLVARYRRARGSDRSLELDFERVLSRPAFDDKVFFLDPDRRGCAVDHEIRKLLAAPIQNQVGLFLRHSHLQPKTSGKRPRAFLQLDLEVVQ